MSLWKRACSCSALPSFAHCCAVLLSFAQDCVLVGLSKVEISHRWVVLPRCIWSRRRIQLAGEIERANDPGQRERLLVGVGKPGVERGPSEFYSVGSQVRVVGGGGFATRDGCR